MFKHEELLQFEGIRVGESFFPSVIKYVLSEAKGDVAEICYMGDGEWRFYIDNFPSRKLFYQTNFPIKNAKEFIREAKRIGINLKLKTT